jgi:hypothetical protein
MSEDRKIPVVDFRDKKAVLNAAMLNSGELSSMDKKAQKQLKKEIEKANTTVVKFTDKEISQMPKNIQRLIIIDKKRCRLRTRQSGKNSITYQIRFRRDGYEINANGKTIELAKQNFIEKSKTAKTKSQNSNSFPKTFHSFAMYYFQHFRKEKVAEKTYTSDLNRYKKYLYPHFGEENLSKITPSGCKEILDKVKSQGKGKTADELYSLMNTVFNGAISHGLIERNPLTTVLHIQHDRTEGKALTAEELQTLFNWLPSSECAVEIALILFCGLRPNEMENKTHPPIREGAFIKAVNSKRKFKDKNKIEYKYIPICSRAKPFFENGITVHWSAKSVRRRLQKILPNNTLKDLRTTFYTKCQIFGVAEPALKEFMGHSFGTLGNAYSDLSKYGDYLLQEGIKLEKW